ncbi:MAG: hypothetical protein WCT04_24480 [Planctomycetota bacterium]
MSVRALNRISPRRRDLIFGEICDLVRESAGIDRSLQASVGEEFGVDETLEEIVKLLRSEFRRVEKRRAKCAA